MFFQLYHTEEFFIIERRIKKNDVVVVICRRLKSLENCVKNIKKRDWDPRHALVLGEQ
jgi:hypothetical protein